MFSFVNASLFCTIVALWAVLFLFTQLKPAIVQQLIQKAAEKPHCAWLVVLVVLAIGPWVALAVADWRTTLVAMGVAWTIEFTTAMVRIYVFKRKPEQYAG